MTTKTADEAFQAVKTKFGFVPNLIREMASSPAVAQAYLRGQDAMAQASLSGPEQQLVQFAVAVYNECPYCRAAHRAGCRGAGVAQAEIDLVEKGAVPEDRRLRSLVSATWQVLDTRGWLGASDLANLEAEGVDRGQLGGAKQALVSQEHQPVPRHVRGTDSDGRAAHRHAGGPAP